MAMLCLSSHLYSMGIIDNMKGPEDMDFYGKLEELKTS